VIARQGNSNEVQLLLTSSQCVPILFFEASAGANPSRKVNSLINWYHKKIQSCVDQHLNRTLAPLSSVDNLFSTIYYQAPDTLFCAAGRDSFDDIADPPAGEDCVICLSPLTNEHDTCISTKACRHYFHRTCIENALAHSPSCPSCRKPLAEPQGRMPSGTMKISKTTDSCEGFEHVGSIVMKYDILPGYQQIYHDNPNVPYASTKRTAYIPDNYDGRLLLQRLRYAFSHGLTFTVGQSLTSGENNVVVWASIHHKTSLTGGIDDHGFPDPGYFFNCNEELDLLGVPKY